MFYSETCLIHSPTYWPQLSDLIKDVAMSALKRYLHVNYKFVDYQVD